jgi:hypothetical protein
MDLRDGGLASLDAEARELAQRRALEALRLRAPNGDADLQCVTEVDARQLSGGGADEAEVAGLQGPSEARVGRSICSSVNTMAQPAFPGVPGRERRTGPSSPRGPGRRGQHTGAAAETESRREKRCEDEERSGACAEGDPVGQVSHHPSSRSAPGTVAVMNASITVTQPVALAS